VKDQAKFAIFFGLLFLHLILISFQVPKGNEPTYFERGIFAVFSPIQHGVGSFFRGLREFWGDYFYLRDVRRQNQELRSDNFLLRQENQLLNNLVHKYRNEKEITDLLSTLSRSILVASVIGLDSSQIYKSVVLSKGSRDGVKKDMVVLDKQGYLVGRVINPISLKQARVQLITDDESGVGVLTERFKVVGILGGDGAGGCLMKYVLKTNREVEAGEKIVTSGFDGIYPSGLPVGRIVSITEHSDLFKKILVEPYFDFSELDQVAVIAVDIKGLT
jgi:rod shape-determining protein MreC